MYPKIINIIGLILDIAGAYIMFSNTPHPSSKPDTTPKIKAIWKAHDWETRGKFTEENEKKRVRLGMWFLISGFVAQGISTLLQ